MIFYIEKSHVCNTPVLYHANSLEDLRNQLQSLADKNDMGMLKFRYELDENDRPVSVHVYFTNRAGNNSRFMRLRRKP